MMALQIHSKELNEAVKSVIGIDLDAPASSITSTSIERVYAYHHASTPAIKELFLITFDDRVLVYGSNKDGILGLGNEKPPLSSLVLNKNLTGRKLMDVRTTGGYHVIALTRGGKV